MLGLRWPGWSILHAFSCLALAWGLGEGPDPGVEWPGFELPCPAS